MTSFNTSKAASLTKSDTIAHEMNVRSVLATLSICQAELKQFCGSLELPAPVTKKPFNNIITSE